MFVESKGAVTFRQGDDNLVSRNIFLGNNVKSTGGVRLTSFNNTVKDNYFEGLQGNRGRSALTIMNGQSDTPPILYKQVQKARVENNSFINTHMMSFGFGTRKRQTYVPLESVVEKNIIANTSDEVTQITIDDDISDIRFNENFGNVVINENNNKNTRQTNITR